MPVQITLEQLQDLVFDAGSLPQLPQTPLRLTSLLDSPDSSPREIEQLISAEPALTAGIMAATASAAYARRNGPATTVRQAMVVLGHNAIRALAVALWTQALFYESGQQTFFDADRFARNGRFVGSLGSYLYSSIVPTPRANEWVAEEAYAGGVLHEVAQGVLSIVHPALYDELYMSAKKLEVTIDTAFASRFGGGLNLLAEPTIGALKLPGVFQSVLRFAHAPVQAGVDAVPVACIAAAAQVADSLGLGVQRWAVAQVEAVECEVLGTLDPAVLKSGIEVARKVAATGGPPRRAA